MLPLRINSHKAKHYLFRFTALIFKATSILLILSMDYFHFSYDKNICLIMQLIFLNYFIFIYLLLLAEISNLIILKSLRSNHLNDNAPHKHSNKINKKLNKFVFSNWCLLINYYFNIFMITVIMSLSFM